MITRRALAAVLAMTPFAAAASAPVWRTIETAPKDGTEILGWNPHPMWGGRRVIAWNPIYPEAPWHTGHGTFSPEWHYTHWAPLTPEPA